MIRPGGPISGGDGAVGASLQLLLRVRDLTAAARVSLDDGDTEDAFVAIDEVGTLLDEGRASIEAFIATRSERSGTATAGDEMFTALSEVLEQHSRLIARLREAASGVADEITRMEATRRTMRAYGHLDATPTVSVRR